MPVAGCQLPPGVSAMADAPKPEGSGTTTSSVSGPTAGTVRFPGADEEAARDRGEDIVYRPLSSFAIAAFSIAAIYSAVVVIGAIVAAFQRMPWIIGGWSAV